MNYEDQVTKQYLEDAIANAGAKIVTGTYIGNGAETRTIDLGFTPRALYVSDSKGATYYTAGNNYYFYGGLVFPDMPIMQGINLVLSIVNNGFRVSRKNNGNYAVSTNENTIAYRYIALK